MEIKREKKRQTDVGEMIKKIKQAREKKEDKQKWIK